MTIKEAATIWKISERRVNELCKTQRIQGAYKDGKQWVIPNNAQKPSDKRFRKDLLSSNLTVKKLPVGETSYRNICTNGYYIDKTMLIRDLLENSSKVSLFTRPNRFGKTLTMDMLRTFFEKTEEDTSIYFRDKEIWSCGNQYCSHLGKYPVIFLSFKDVKYSCWEETFTAMRKLIALEFNRHGELAFSSALNSYEKEQFSLLATETADAVTYQMSLHMLTLFLHKHYGTAPIILIDEYDTPIQQGHIHGFYDLATGFLRNLFSGGLKDNPHLNFGVLMGILPFAKESVFRDLNDLEINTILDEQYSEYFGFTSDEVLAIAEYCKATEKYQEICDWYGGYRFGNTELFNPWSVIGYLNNNCQPKAYWQSSIANTMISKVIKSDAPAVMEQLTMFLNETSFDTCIDIGTIYPQSQDDPIFFYSFLLMNGYLKIENCNQPLDQEYLCEVGLTNKEIVSVCIKEILAQLEVIVPRFAIIALREAIYKMDLNAIQKAFYHFLQSLLLHNVDNKAFYRTLELGMNTILNKSYHISFDRKTTDSNFTIRLIPLCQQFPGILVNFRTGNTSSGKHLDDLARSALQEIDICNLTTPNVLKYGMAFSDGNVRIAAELQSSVNGLSCITPINF